MTTIPQGMRGKIASEFGAQFFNRRRESDIEKYVRTDLRSASGPVLERVLLEIGRRKDETTVVPDIDDDCGQCDFVDLSGFSGHDDDVIDLHDVAEREMQSGEDISERGLSSNANNNRDESSRCKQPGADRAERRKSHERYGHRDDDDKRNDQTSEQRYLRDRSSIADIVRIARVRESIDDHCLNDIDAGDEQPGQRNYERDLNRVIDVNTPTVIAIVDPAPAELEPDDSQDCSKRLLQ